MITGPASTSLSLRRAASWLLLAALLLRGLIPVGFMPDLSALSRGAFPLVICSNGLEHTILVDENGTPVKEQPAAHNQGPCVFAAMVSLAPPLLLALLLLVPTWPQRTAWRLPRAILPPLLRPPGTAGARAPPLFA